MAGESRNTLSLAAIDLLIPVEDDMDILAEFLRITDPAFQTVPSCAK